MTVGRRVGDRIEITGGLDADARVVAAGGGFLADGDMVRVVEHRRRAASADRRVGSALRRRHERMMNVSSWSIRNPIPAVLLFIMLTLVGLMGFRAMKIQNFPDIDLPTVTVTASLPGASPAQLETEVARKIENSIATLQGVKHIYTHGAGRHGDDHGRVPAREADAGSGRRRARRGRRACAPTCPADLRDPVITKMTSPARRS